MNNGNPIKRKICHVTSVHPRYDVRILHKECKSLASNGFDVVLLVNDNLPDENIDGVQIISTHIKPRSRLERVLKSKKILKQKMLQINAEVYHFHDPELLPEAVWIKKEGKKVIFDFHEDVSQQILFKPWIPKIIRKFTSKIYKKYEKNRIKKFDALITVTPKFVDRLKQINPNTIMITNYPILKEKVVNDQISKKKAICFAGGISPQWNHENIIRAIESIDDIEYIIAGSGSPKYIQKLKKLPGWSKVRYLGRIPHEKVMDIYSEAMIGMTLLSNNTQVSDEGTLGNTKIFEFMEAELPIICSNNRIWTEIVTKYNCGIAIDPNNINEIISAIKYITEYQNKAFDLGKNGRRAVEERYNWKKQEIVLLNAYSELPDLTINIGEESINENQI